MLPIKWLVYRTPLVMPPLHRLVPVGERRRWIAVLNECYKNLLQEAHYQGVFDALRSGSTQRASWCGAGPRTAAIPVSRVVGVPPGRRGHALPFCCAALQEARDATDLFNRAVDLSEMLPDHEDADVASPGSLVE